MDKTRDDSKPFGSGAVYKASENIPSVRTLLPTPKFIAPPEPESCTAPAGIHFDGKGLQTNPGHAVTGTIAGHQELTTPLVTPTRFDPKLMRHVPVELPLADDAKPATARPVHDVRKAQNS